MGFENDNGNNQVLNYTCDWPPLEFKNENREASLLPTLPRFFKILVSIDSIVLFLVSGISKLIKALNQNINTFISTN